MSNPAQLVELQEYVDIKFKGNKAAFGRAFNKLPQNVTKLFHAPEKWAIVCMYDREILVQLKVTREL